MPDAWSREEIELIVADYRAMLLAELRGGRYSKAEHRRNLQEQLNNRSEGSIEYKHQNISAVLVEQGFPAIDGYKPAHNYQRGLFPEIVLGQIANSPAVRAEAARLAEEHAVEVPSVEDILAVLVEPPEPRERTGNAVRDATTPRTDIDYAAREAANRSLGLKGEQFVLNYERARLIKAGKESLADHIEHTSVEQGDGAGFDIRSFEETGSDRLIEVKTTRYSRHTPFYMSSNELAVSSAKAERYYLYRVFRFSRAPGLYTLKGRLEGRYPIEPTQYRVAP
jgi:hypothetical protein